MNEDKTVWAVIADDEDSKQIIGIYSSKEHADIVARLLNGGILVLNRPWKNENTSMPENGYMAEQYILDETVSDVHWKEDMQLSDELNPIIDETDEPFESQDVSNDTDDDIYNDDSDDDGDVPQWGK